MNLHFANWRHWYDKESSQARLVFLAHPTGLLWEDAIRVTARLCLAAIITWHKPGLLEKQCLSVADATRTSPEEEVVNR